MKYQNSTKKNILLKDEDALVKELFNKDWHVKP